MICVFSCQPVLMFYCAHRVFLTLLLVWGAGSVQTTAEEMMDRDDDINRCVRHVLRFKFTGQL